MSKLEYLLLSISVMAIITYLTRVIPLIMCNKKIENKYIRTFLSYLPYGVLAAMVFPEILYSTSGLISGAVGAVVAMALAYFKRGLVTVAIGATAAVFVTELIIGAVA